MTVQLRPLPPVEQFGDAALMFATVGVLFVLTAIETD
jgi:hypothetical protein